MVSRKRFSTHTKQFPVNHYFSVPFFFPGESLPDITAAAASAASSAAADMDKHPLDSKHFAVAPVAVSYLPPGGGGASESQKVCLTKRFFKRSVTTVKIAHFALVASSK